ncbi:MAG: hypothetical protein KC449_22130, partial [Anaerolineales bacterium]|nr:hypothetical protein [Anaerolineales bacterium]
MNLPLQPLDESFEVPLPLMDWELLEKLKKEPDVRFVPALIDEIYKLHEIITSSEDDLRIEVMKSKDFNEVCQH